ncbi:MAG TPA: preprotein translocase subunit SecG [Alteromonas macleodii]|jgi:preprotein translocase subunit SecG|uniref:Protein-export membrane protein SecG n=1 Tax=Alteromonas australica TaxID=589873 RepID=A0A075NW62_9ALTE|nr:MULTISPECIES: preprotein translocase subunit SecG [Alteromonas]MAB92135.1 preprotein translocase subunit SecG [Alteromonas sp.]HBN98222.1 preprotein translocase subunit SecG [Alteromonas macleodii]AIF98844.1 preprotein translocase subunit SecG [Alteromonas australica]MAF71414.1 preprotein translocase subunit SecG [Alteromonas sp.]MAO30034.1 preprotein translocase subunit SecG [Alteromonas sp.]|tara:strand:- start:968 stop:1360 length:393 start_codon:yes stop_codon:yes gene_type:complete
MVYEVLLVAYLIVALLLIGFVLIQQGKGADMGASFGSGGSNTVFGSSGSGNFMSRTTAVLAGLFFFISLTLGALTANKESAEDEWENLEVPAVVEAPVQTPADQDVPMGEVPESAIDDVPQVDKSSDVPN